MQIAVGQDDEAAVLRFRVFAGLLFANERVFVFRLGFQHDKGKTFVVQEQKIDETFADFFEIRAKVVNVLCS